MIHFPVLRMKRLTVQLRELTIGQSIEIAQMPPHLEQSSITKLLQSAVEKVDGKELDPRHWTVQERIMAICYYLASTDEDSPDFSVGNGKFSDYFDSDDAGVDGNLYLGEVGGDIWEIRHLTGAMAESIERLSGEIEGITSRLHWLLGGMAAQMVLKDHDNKDPRNGEAIFDQYMIDRMKIIAGYPDSNFASLLNLYLDGRNKLRHLFNIDFSDEGIIVLPKGGVASNLPPARFRLRSCISKYVFGLV